MSRRRITLGANGEAAAARHLERHGCSILEQNHVTRFGEIDLIAKDGDEVVFVEVKTRQGRTYGYPEEAVTYAKRRHLRMAAEAWMAARKYEGACRIDVIAVTRSLDAEEEIVWIRDAVGAE